jgi:hypothetical protein
MNSGLSLYKTSDSKEACSNHPIYKSTIFKKEACINNKIIAVNFAYKFLIRK